MTLRAKLMTSVGGLLVSSGLAAAAPAIVADSVNLRAGPGPDYEIIGAMPAGATVNVLGCGPSWCRVSFSGALGFASRNYLEIGTAAVRPGYRADEGYAYGGYDTDGDSGPYVSEGYTAGYGERSDGDEVVAGDRAGVEVRGTDIRRSERTVERRAPVAAQTRSAEQRSSANVRVNTRASRSGATVNADTNANARATTGATNRTARDGDRSNLNDDANTRSTTGAGSNTGDQADHGPNFIGGGAQYRDNHP